MSPLSTRLETILNEAERKALVAVLRSRPELTLEKLQDCFVGRYGDTLRSITVGELIELDVDLDLPEDGVFDVIGAAGGHPVSAGYLRARVGGPRWKLQGSLRRLVDAGKIDRKGVTSSTRYRVVVRD
jgi:hypothetical protein